MNNQPESGSRLDRIEAAIEANQQQIQANQQQTQKNTEAIAELRATVGEVLEGQRMLVQMFVEEREINREHRRQQQQEMAEFRQDMRTMQQQIAILQQNSDRVLDYLFRRYNNGDSTAD